MFNISTNLKKDTLNTQKTLFIGRHCPTIYRDALINYLQVNQNARKQ